MSRGANRRASSASAVGSRRGPCAFLRRPCPWPNLEGGFDGSARTFQNHGFASGKAMTSRIDLAPVIDITMRSMPMASPPHGGMPDSMERRNASLRGSASSHPAARALLFDELVLKFGGVEYASLSSIVSADGSNRSTRGEFKTGLASRVRRPTRGRPGAAWSRADRRSGSGSEARQGDQQATSRAGDDRCAGFAPGGAWWRGGLGVPAAPPRDPAPCDISREPP